MDIFSCVLSFPVIGGSTAVGLVNKYKNPCKLHHGSMVILRDQFHKACKHNKIAKHRKALISRNRLLFKITLKFDLLWLVPPFNFFALQRNLSNQTIKYFSLLQLYKIGTWSNFVEIFSQVSEKK